MAFDLIEVKPGKDDRLIRAFYSELYLPAFPQKEHREDLETWQVALAADPAVAPCRSRLLLAGHNLRQTAPVVWGGLMFELYQQSECGLLTYLVVAPDRRGQGLARALVSQGLPILNHDMQARGRPLRAVFGECIDPRRAAGEGIEEAWQRLRILGRLGAKVIDMPYTAPALGPGRGRARDLMLLCFPSFAAKQTVPDRATVVNFLADFYRNQDSPDPETDADFRASVAALATPQPHTFELRRETPAITLNQVALAFHFVRRGPKPDRLPNDPLFHSFEHDLVSHAYREARPFASESLGHAYAVDVQYASELDVHSEGRTIRVVTGDQDAPGSGRRRRLEALRSRTVFADGVVVDHLVLGNLRLPDSVLNELDLIKLIKLHGGGEGSSVHDAVTFSIAGRDFVPFGRWVAQLDGPPGAPGLDAGTLRATTVLITTGDDAPWLPVYEHVSRIPDEAELVASTFRKLLDQGHPDAHRLKGIEGIVCSLLNFEEIDHWELVDALEPALASPEYLLWLQKATLVCLTRSDRITSIEACRRGIGTTPYLLAPHAVLLHNEEILRLAAQTINEATAGDSRKKVEQRRRDVDGNLKEHLLPNVFHYRTERTIFDAGDRDRGLGVRAADLNRRLAQVEGDLAERAQRAQRRAEQALTVIFGLLSATALRDFWVMAVPETKAWQTAGHFVPLLVVGVAMWLLLRHAERG